MEQRQSDIFGIVARYEHKEQMLAAARLLKKAGIEDVEAYTPFPVEELAEILDHKEKVLPWVIFWGGVFGGVGGFLMLYSANVWFLPLDIGGRPYNSWPAFIPITFELTILFAALAGFFGLILKCRLPKLHHPIFNAHDFERATLDSFFLCVRMEGKQQDFSKISARLRETRPESIEEVRC